MVYYIIYVLYIYYTRYITIIIKIVWFINCKGTYNSGVRVRRGFWFLVCQ